MRRAFVRLLVIIEKRQLSLREEEATEHDIEKPSDEGLPLRPSDCLSLMRLRGCRLLQQSQLLLLLLRCGCKADLRSGQAGQPASSALVSLFQRPINCRRRRRRRWQSCYWRRRTRGKTQNGSVLAESTSLRGLRRRIDGGSGVRACVCCDTYNPRSSASRHHSMRRLQFSYEYFN